MEIFVYDFDKTIYDGDSTLDFYFYCLKKHFALIRYIPIQIISFILYTVGIYDKVRFKEGFFSFLKGLKDIDYEIEEFWNINRIKMKSWYKDIEYHDKDVIISASPEFLLKPICDELDIYMMIASRVNKYNGIFDGENCHDKEKVLRLNKEIKEYTIKEFYSDSLSDSPLAELSEKSYIVQKNNFIKWNEYKESGVKKFKNIFLSKDFILFILIGVINTFNGVLFAYIYSLLMNENIAFIIGYITSLTISYYLNSVITFKEKLAMDKYIKFCISYIPNFLIQNVIVIIFLNILGWNKLIVYLLAAAIGVPVTFILIKFFAFKKNNEKYK